MALNLPLSKRIVKPSDCILAFGIPTSRQAFFRALENPANRDFVVNRCPVWEKYYYDVVSEIELVEPGIKSLGTRVVHDVALKRLGELFQQESFTTLILFCHWQNESVEFDDGLATVPKVIAQIPPSAPWFIDLCVCHPEGLSLAIDRLRPKCLTRYTNGVATPSFWLYFYWALFKSLTDFNMTYLQGLEKTIEAFLD